MAARLPLLLSDILPQRELAKDAALYFNALDEVGIANVITQFCRDRDLRTKMSEKAANCYLKYDMNIFVEEHLKVYKRLESGEGLK